MNCIKIGFVFCVFSSYDCLFVCLFVVGFCFNHSGTRRRDYLYYMYGQIERVFIYLTIVKHLLCDSLRCSIYWSALISFSAIHNHLMCVKMYRHFRFLSFSKRGWIWFLLAYILLFGMHLLSDLIRFDERNRKQKPLHSPRTIKLSLKVVIIIVLLALKLNNQINLNNLILNKTTSNTELAKKKEINNVKN